MFSIWPCLNYDYFFLCVIGEHASKSEILDINFLTKESQSENRNYKNKNFLEH